MNKKKALRKLVFAEILTSKARFLSILSLILLGVAFFSGLNASGPDMLKTAALYFKNQNLMDIRVVSTLGLTDKDIDILSGLPDIDKVEAGYNQDVVTDKEVLLKVLSYDSADTMNRFVLEKGRLPEKSGEIALISSKKIKKTYKIGDTVNFIPDSEDNDITEQFKKTSYTVVGFITSPLYISDKNVGSSSVGKGILDGYGAILTDDFNLTAYTDAYVTFKGLNGSDPYSDEYKDKIAGFQDTIKAAFKSRAAERLAEVKSEAVEKLNDAKQEVADGKQKLADGQQKLTDANAQITDGKQQLADAETKLADAKKKLDDGYQEYTKNKADFDKQIADAQEQLNDGASQINIGQNKVTAGYQQLDQGNAQITDGLNQLNEKENSLTAQQQQLQQYLAQTEQVVSVPASYISADQQQALIASGSSIPLNSTQTMGDLWAGYFNSTVSKDTLLAAIQGVTTQIESGLATIENTRAGLLAKQQELSDAKEQLDSNNIILNSSAITLSEKTKEFETQKAEGEAKLADGLKQLEEGKAEYNKGVKKLSEEKTKLADAEKEYQDGLKTYTEEKADADRKITDAEEKIADGETKLADLKKPTYYVFTREDNSHYTEFVDDAKNLSALSLVFPSFFFAIAALVCLTTITRMIEEQRVQIGTLKALGYTTGEICSKYYIYALSASMMGALSGLVLGFNLIPRIVFSAYTALYDLPNNQYAFYLSYSFISIGIALFCTGVSAWVVLHQELKSTPSVLMRPKAPKIGKRIFLERVTFIWKRLNFNQKVSMRNLFRYKQRMIMTVFGIAGCMGLMVTGYGLKDSVSNVATLQFENVIHYQAMVVFDKEAVDQDLKDAENTVTAYDGIEDSLYIHEEQLDVKKDGITTQQVILMVPKELERMNQFVMLRNRKTQKEISLSENGAVISEKLSKLYNVSVGDNIELTDSDNKVYKVKVAAITENYAGHYIYMSPETYESVFHAGDITYNSVLLQYHQNTKWEEGLTNKLNQYPAIKAISYHSSTISIFNDSMGSLNAVVLVLIISAATLAFVVLYNLTNINVSERIRELSTIKVLGFYDKEVTMYIYRENLLLSLLGIFFGSFLGLFLHNFVLETAAMNNVMFSPVVLFHSYLYAAILTLLFSSIVMWVMHRKLKHVDMIEALKSNE